MSSDSRNTSAKLNKVPPLFTEASQLKSNTTTLSSAELSTSGEQRRVPELKPVAALRERDEATNAGQSMSSTAAGKTF
eukprot:343054-Rhodomonas_salina.1